MPHRWFDFLSSENHGWLLAIARRCVSAPTQQKCPRRRMVNIPCSPRPFWFRVFWAGFKGLNTSWKGIWSTRDNRKHSFLLFKATFFGKHIWFNDLSFSWQFCWWPFLGWWKRQFLSDLQRSKIKFGHLEPQGNETWICLRWSVPW